MAHTCKIYLECRNHLSIRAPPLCSQFLGMMLIMNRKLHMNIWIMKPFGRNCFHWLREECTMLKNTLHSSVTFPLYPVITELCLSAYTVFKVSFSDDYLRGNSVKPILIYNDFCSFCLDCESKQWRLLETCTRKFV